MQDSQSRCNLSRQLRAESSFRIFPSIAYDLPFEQNSTNPKPLEHFFYGEIGEERRGALYPSVVVVFLASPSCMHDAMHAIALLLAEAAPYRIAKGEDDVYD